ncbi:dimethylarginine dimethylaminohydrolase family protein [Gracilimonas amylolytica]|uniref:dimethylarginine dimethylaminohydrolase family protein n=1 Tax=Gracilimonas amylolytica TaxID=1749045 RepID=UPI000CD92343|nr:arginine deiminase family protein [Gracilimonas amylolytica]
MFRKAIVRKPCPNLVAGITTADLGKPDYHRALLQHSLYVEALRQLDLEVIELEADNRFPDSVFVEDVAVCTNDLGVITRPGAASRRDEIGLIEDVIGSHFERVETIKDPATLEGGDVMMVGSTFYVGLSDRTNKLGISQFRSILEKYGYSVIRVPLGEILHLKTGVSYLEDNNLLVSDEMGDLDLFSSFNKILVPADESYAANCIWINGTVLIPAGFPVTKQKIKDAGYKIIELEMTEFEKLDGGLSCLSLRF